MGVYKICFARGAGHRYGHSLPVGTVSGRSLLPFRLGGGEAERSVGAVHVSVHGSHDALWRPRRLQILCDHAKYYVPLVLCPVGDGIRQHKTGFLQSGREPSAFGPDVRARLAEGSREQTASFTMRKMKQNVTAKCE